MPGEGSGRSRRGSGPAAVAVEPWQRPRQDPQLEQEEPLIGVVLGDRYRVDECIGAGGMGVVYKATHLLIGRKLAIKVLRQRYAEHEDLAKRFAQEARVASSVKHPNVVDIIDYGTTPSGSPYCVMEFLGGRSLAREIADHSSLAPARALSIACDIARGLAAAHRAEVIHRDLKPDNVFLVVTDNEPEQVKILDFGIAQVSGRKGRLTAAGSVVGTPEYMSPEQARGDEIDARSDLYALGVLLFEALTGKVPLSADSAVGTLTKQVFEVAPRLRDLDPRFLDYPSIETALGRLLAKNRDERPATALDAVQLLQTAAANDLEPSADHRGQAALEGWAQPVVSERDIVRRATIMLGSGSVARAHAVEADGPATGEFAAKQGGEGDVSKRPSIIVRDGVPSKARPARNMDVERPAPPSPAGTAPLSRTPTPESMRPLGKPPRRGIRRRHLPLILLGVGAAIFAALVTIGFVRWMQQRELRARGATGVRGSQGVGSDSGWMGVHGRGGSHTAYSSPEHSPPGSSRRPRACSSGLQLLSTPSALHRCVDVDQISTQRSGVDHELQRDARLQNSRLAENAVR